MNYLRVFFLMSLFLLYSCSSPTGNSKSNNKQLILFEMASEKDGNYQLYTIDIDGKNLKQLTNLSNPCINPVWSKDGKFIAFASKDLIEESTTVLRNSYFIMDKDGHNIKQVSRSTEWHGVYDYPSWGINNDLVYYYAGNLYHYSMEIDSSIIILDGMAEFPAVSNFGDKIAFSRFSGFQNLCIVDFNGSNLKVLTEGETIDALFPKWSYDDKYICLKDRTAGYRIFIIDTTGQIIWNKTNENTGFFAWSNAEHKIVFIDDPNNVNDIYMFDVNSSTILNLSKSSEGIHPVPDIDSNMPSIDWSFDDKYVLYHSKNPQNGNTFLVVLDIESNKSNSIKLNGYIRHSVFKPN